MSGRGNKLPPPLTHTKVSPVSLSPMERRRKRGRRRKIYSKQKRYMRWTLAPQRRHRLDVMPTSLSEARYYVLVTPSVCVECLIGKQKKPILFKVTEPSSVPYRACHEHVITSKFTSLSGVRSLQWSTRSVRINEPRAGDSSHRVLNL